MIRMMMMLITIMVIVMMLLRHGAQIDQKVIVLCILKAQANIRTVVVWCSDWPEGG